MRGAKRDWATLPWAMMASLACTSMLCSGHLPEGIVRPTLEVTSVEVHGHRRSRKRPEIGAALIDLNA